MIDSAPAISVIIPTLNSARVLTACLDSMTKQCMPQRGIEFIVVDGGSTDGSREIATRYGARLLENPRRTAEAGKAIGAAAARGEFLAFVDSDNVVVGQHWFEEMLTPFVEADIVAAEPLHYIARPEDGYLTRYFAHLGMGDPTCLFVGNYDRYSVLTGRWTEVPLRTVARSGYYKVWITPGHLPTMGANGFVIRRQALADLGIGDYLFDVDVVGRLVAQQRWAFAKVQCGIVHLFAGDVRTFCRKQGRRVADFLYYRQQGQRTAPSREIRRGLVWFAAATLTGWPLLWQMARGYERTHDYAWFFHPAACSLTLFQYARGVVMHRLQGGPMPRDGWKQ